MIDLGDVPWAKIDAQVGKRDLSTTANSYTRRLADERELDYEPCCDKRVPGKAPGRKLVAYWMQEAP
jgi:hypothetical protein